MIVNPSHITRLVEVKQYDTDRILLDTLTIDGSPINLTSGSVFLNLYNIATETNTKVSASIVTATSGSVQYPLSASFITSSGEYLAEWEVHTSASKEVTLPTAGYIKLTVIPDLDNL